MLVEEHVGDVLEPELVEARKQRLLLEGQMVADLAVHHGEQLFEEDPVGGVRWLQPAVPFAVADPHLKLVDDVQRGDVLFVQQFIDHERYSFQGTCGRREAATCVRVRFRTSAPNRMNATAPASPASPPRRMTQALPRIRPPPTRSSAAKWHQR